MWNTGREASYLGRCLGGSTRWECARLNLIKGEQGKWCENNSVKMSEEKIGWDDNGSLKVVFCLLGGKMKQEGLERYRR